MPSKIKDVIRWPEFRQVWILLGVVAVAGAIDAVGLGAGIFLFVSIGLLAIVFILVAYAVYRAAALDRATRVDQSELRSILAALNDALIVYDENFNAIFFNPAAEHLFRLGAKTVLGHRFVPQDVEREGWRTLIQVIFPSLAPRVIVRSKGGEFPQVVDTSFSDPDLELRVTTAPIVDEGGRTLGFMKIVRDRTAQVAALRARSEFVTVVSHQLRNPVTDIEWALQSLEKDEQMSETSRTIVETALASTRSIVDRIESMINISKMEDGKFGYKFAEADAVAFIGKVLADVLPAAKTAGVKLYFDRPATDLPKVMIDEQRLSLALVNLLENAIRYNVANGEVTVKVDAVPGKSFLEISVKDTGIGVPAESIQKLFTKFYRADNAVKSQTEGSGLGLYITKGIIRAHGGDIWVDSEINRGTTVHFTLPTDLNLVPKHETGLEDLA